MVNVYYYDLEVKQIYLVLLSPLAYAVWIEIIFFDAQSICDKVTACVCGVDRNIHVNSSENHCVVSPLAYAVWIEICLNLSGTRASVVTACVCGVDRNRL